MTKSYASQKTNVTINISQTRRFTEYMWACAIKMKVKTKGEEDLRFKKEWK